MWTPQCIDIPRNKSTDRLLKLPYTSASLPITSPLIHSTLIIRQLILKKMATQLAQFTRTALRLIKFTIFPWPSSYLPSGIKETTLCRLRIAYSPSPSSIYPSIYSLPNVSTTHTEKVNVSHYLLHYHTLIPSYRKYQLFSILRDLFCDSSSLLY